MVTQDEDHLTVERRVPGREPLLSGVARRLGDRLAVRFPSRAGVTGALIGAGAGPGPLAVYTIDGDAIEGLIHDSGRTRGWSWCSERGRRVSFVQLAEYAFGPAGVPLDRGVPIDLAAENLPVSNAILATPPSERGEYPLIIVPGYTPLGSERPVTLSGRTKRRLRRAVDAYREHDSLAILVTGGNVYPDGTPNNEAAEMKRYLLEKLQIPADRIALEPYARHSTTNLRNAARFMLAHGLAKALIVTTRGQSFYFSFPRLSTYRRRCRQELGYELGRLRFVSPSRTSFEPSNDVLQRGSDPLDP